LGLQFLQDESYIFLVAALEEGIDGVRFRAITDFTFALWRRRAGGSRSDRKTRHDDNKNGKHGFNSNPHTC
jgi:hypothetical protein